MNDPNFFDMERENEKALAARKRLGDEAKKAFEDCFDTPAGRRVLEILCVRLKGKSGELEGPTDPVGLAMEDTRRRVYWFIAGMARKTSEREIV